MFEIFDPFDKTQTIVARVPFAFIARVICWVVPKWDYCDKNEPWLFDKAGN